MREWIRRYLGIENVATAMQLETQQTKILHEIFLLRNELVVTFNDELSPKRKELSDELGRRMIEKLKAEDLARRHTLGEL